MNEKKTIEALKNQIAELPLSEAGRRRYPRAVKEGVLALLEVEGAGWTQARLAAELGLNQATVSNWRKTKKNPLQVLGKCRPVRLAREEEASDVHAGHGRALVLPSGIRVEGLGLDELLELVRELR